VLNANLARLGEDVTRLAEGGADAIQWDVMDGHFVPNLTFGAEVIKQCRDLTDIPYEAHLMITEGERWVEDYVKAGCETVIVHPEAIVHLHRCLEEIRRMGARAGVALNPATPLEVVRHVMGSIDHLLVMTVNPGFGGQAYISEMEVKVAEARAMIDATGRDIALEVDGGITPETAKRAIAAGATVLVAGTAVFQGGPAKYAANIQALRG
jgi:ribulose-phosphate 3-epimerase